MGPIYTVIIFLKLCNGFLSKKSSFYSNEETHSISDFGISQVLVILTKLTELNTLSCVNVRKSL